jgi:hypothetical protein
MRNVLAGLALSTCLLATACGGQEPLLVEAAPIASASPSLPAPVATEPITSAAPRKSAKPVVPSSPSARLPSRKPAVSKAPSDPAAACRASVKVGERLGKVREANNPWVIGRDATAEEVAAAVAALLPAQQTAVRGLIAARGLTSDAVVRDALADMIAAEKAVLALLKAVGTDVLKLYDTFATKAEIAAERKLLGSSDGVCAAYLD